MKKVILSIVFVAASIITFAGTNTTTATAEKNISLSFKNQIRFPEFLKEKEGEHSAAIFFKVTEQGLISVREIQCDDAELKTDLRDQTQTIRVSSAGLDTRDTYKVVVRFETL